MTILKKGRHSNSGFTLIELMIVIIIVSVLMAIALPAFQNQMIRGYRGAAKSALLDIANREVQYLLANRSYADPNDFGYTPPDDAAKFYTFSISTTPVSPGVPYFVLTATPTAGTRQAKDGLLTLDSEGVKGPPANLEKWER